MKLYIEEEFAKHIPPLSDDEFKQLEENCLKHGIKDDIIVICEHPGNYCKYCYKETEMDFDGEYYTCTECDHSPYKAEYVIIDGHNRYKIAQKHDLDFMIHEMEFESKDDIKEWMILNQFGRRNLSAYQRSILALKLEDVFKEKAKKNLSEAGGDRKSDNKKSGLPILAKAIDTRKEIAKIANVSHGTIDKVKKIEKEAPEDIKAKLSTGEISINHAYKEIKKEERRQNLEEQKEEIKQLNPIDGQYDILVFDPPWPYGRGYDPDGSRVANPYPEMSIQEIKNISIPKAKNSILFLWTTHKFLPDSFDIMKHWGYDYKATMVWNKEKIGMGHWLRMQCEFCLLGISGNPVWDIRDWRDIITESRKEHSRKPNIFFKAIDQYFPHYSKLEYFSREQRDGWESFGNEINKFNE